jgi:mRNA-degrading endonuclease toxin of MazEF toxin-antitoxin module
VSPSRPLQFGSVVWAELEDANGYRKARPVVVVTPTADINAGKHVRVVAITTRLPNPCPTIIYHCPRSACIRPTRTVS